MREKESPAANGAIKNLAGGSIGNILQAGSGIAPINENPAAVYFRQSFAVLVRGKTIRRHLYFNLPAAERVVKRALARGDRADLVLVKLVPVDARHLEGDDAL